MLQTSCGAERVKREKTTTTEQTINDIFFFFSYRNSIKAEIPMPSLCAKMFDKEKPSQDSISRSSIISYSVFKF